MNMNFGEQLKSELKNLPIWEDVDKFRTDLDRVKLKLDELFEQQTDIASRIEALSDLNVSPAPGVSGPIKQYLNGTTTHQKTSKSSSPIKKSEATSSTTDKEPESSRVIYDASLKLLAKKIETNVDVYGMLKQGKPWVRSRVRSVFFRHHEGSKLFTFRLINPPGYNSRFRDVDKYAIARIQNHSTGLAVGKRVIAGLTCTEMLPGIIGQEPEHHNDYRYMVFMDHGPVYYFKPHQIYPILWQSKNPWLDSNLLNGGHADNNAYLRYYFANYPKRELIQVRVGDVLQIIRDRKFSSAEVIEIDCDTMKLRYKDKSVESVYRGSPRLVMRKDIVSRKLACLRTVEKFFPDLVEKFDDYHQAGRKALDEDYYCSLDGFGGRVIVSKNSNVARKSTARGPSPKRPIVNLDSELVAESSSIEPWDEEKFERSKQHKCSTQCLEIPGVKTELAVSDVRAEFRNISDLKVPLILGWKRRLSQLPHKGKIKLIITYEAPCEKIFQQIYEIKRYLGWTKSKLDIDYFSFERYVKLNRELGDIKPFFYKENIAVDKVTGKLLENKFISAANSINREELSSDFEYRSETFPHPSLEAKNFSFNTDFKSCCDCEDDCQQRATCACHVLNCEIGGKSVNRGTIDDRFQYRHKRLFDQVATGIFECNSWCKCSSKCTNRVVQNGIRFRLQVQNTLSKGWGVVTLDDIPKGAFICTYSAELLDDADQHGASDMYYADLDYISVNEEMKRCEDSDNSDEGVGCEFDENESKRKKIKGKTTKSVAVGSDDEKFDDNSSVSSLEREVAKATIAEDSTTTRYPKRTKNPPKPRQQVRPQGNKKTRFVRIHEILDSHDFTLDARIRGNVGRFFNHSCDPNSFVQNVFIETHDLRFPVVAFFTLRNIKALEEITWNYNYKIDTIEGRRIDCSCMASNCRGRIL